MITNPHAVAAVYEAAVHCIGCAEKRFGASLYDREPPKDDDGNRVSLIFDRDDALNQMALQPGSACKKCHTEL